MKLAIFVLEMSTILDCIKVKCNPVESSWNPDNVLCVSVEY